MNHYARQFRHLRRPLSPGVRARSALAWLALGFALGLAVNWRPTPRPAHPARPVQPLRADRAALAGHRIRVLSTMVARPGEPGAGLDAWLRATLRADGARVDTLVSASDRGDTSTPELELRFEPVAAGPLDRRGPWFAFATGDSSAARAAACLAAEISFDFARPLVTPRALPGSRLPGAGAPGVVVYVPPASIFDSTQQRTAQAMARALALHLRAAPASAATPGDSLGGR